MLGFISGLVFAGLNANAAWRWMFGMGAVLPCILTILVFSIMPESPRWLVQKERYTEAGQVLQQVYGEGKKFLFCRKHFFVL